MVWPFKRKETTALGKLSGGEWRCSGCDQIHTGMFDLAAFAPDPWPHPDEYEPNSSVRLTGDFLSEDFCVIGGEHFFVRCVLKVPVHGLTNKFGYGCWGSLKRENFELYLKHFDDGSLPDGAPFWSWLCNRIKPFEVSEPLGCLMYPQLDRQRPVLMVEHAEHPVAIAQDAGISPEALFQIYAANGHDIA
ncbi:MAG: DUF2199 domain-containing protein [Pseudomonadota bacterium]